MKGHVHAFNILTVRNGIAKIFLSGNKLIFYHWIFFV